MGEDLCGDSYDAAYSVQQIPDGGYVIAGYTSSFGSKHGDAWILKLDNNGNVPDCNISKPVHANVTATSATVTETSTEAISSSATAKDSKAVVKDANAIITKICPERVTFAAPEETNPNYQKKLKKFLKEKEHQVLK